jgi:hypothetical protein
MLIYMHQQYVAEGSTSVSDKDLPDLETMDGVLAVLSLINIAELSNVLHPDTYRAGVEPQDRVFLIHVRKLGRHLLHWLNCHYLIEPAPYPGNLISTKRTTPPLSKMYLLHQVHALQSGTRNKMKGVSLNSDAGHWCKAVMTQIIGCMGRSEEIVGQADTFAWEIGTHKVAKRCPPLLSTFGMYVFMNSRNLLIDQMLCRWRW